MRESTGVSTNRVAHAPRGQLQRRRGTQPHTVLVRRKRERALFAAGKNRTARVDDNRDAALFNGNRKCDRGHRLWWCTATTDYSRLQARPVVGGAVTRSVDALAVLRFLALYNTIIICVF